MYALYTAPQVISGAIFISVVTFCLFYLIIIKGERSDLLARHRKAKGATPGDMVFVNGMRGSLIEWVDGDVAKVRLDEGFVIEARYDALEVVTPTATDHETADPAPAAEEGSVHHL